MAKFEYLRYVILLAMEKPDLFTEELVRAHVAHLTRLEDSDRPEICGPLSEKGGMVILRNVPRDEARAIAESDPFVSSGAETFELRELTVSCRGNNHLGMG